MSLSDLLLLLIVGILAFIALKLNLIAYSVDKIAGVSHYQQQNAFAPGLRAPKVKRADTTERITKPIQNSGLVDMTELPDDLAIQAIEGWGDN